MPTKALLSALERRDTDRLILTADQAAVEGLGAFFLAVASS